MEDVNWESNYDRYNEMIYDAIGASNIENVEEEPNPEAKGFYDLLEAAAKPLWEGCVHSRLSCTVRMLSVKADANQTQDSFNQWATLINELVPESDDIPKSFYEAKKLASKLGLKMMKINCC